MKKLLEIIMAVLMAVVLIVISVLCIKSKSQDNNVKAEEDEKGRYLTIVNDTGEIINEVYVYVGEGTEIESAHRENPDKKSFSIELPKGFDEYRKFTVLLVDRYEVEYKKEISDVKEKGRTEVVISKDDKDEETDSSWKKIVRFFNKD